VKLGFFKKSFFAMIAIFVVAAAGQAPRFRFPAWNSHGSERRCNQQGAGSDNEINTGAQRSNGDGRQWRIQFHASPSGNLQRRSHS